MSLKSRFRFSGKHLLFGCVAASAPLVSASLASAQAPTAQQALALAPLQKDVDFDKPTGDDIAKCTIKVEKGIGTSGWIVMDGSGQIIRRFTDTNGDNTVDLWSYFSGGLEVYRDIDSNANGKADQFRWLNANGSRWGLDTNEDGKIDAWKSISAEEVSAEAVAAMGSRDEARFNRLLITSEELAALGLGEAHVKQIQAKLAAVPKRFSLLGTDDKTAMVSSIARWLNFSGMRPSAIPVGTEGSTKDITVYENIITMFETGGKTGQLQIGTMIKVGDGWRLFDVPERMAEGENQNQVAAGLFGNQVRTVPGIDPTKIADGVPGATGGLPGKVAEIDDKIDKCRDKKQLGELKKEKADVIENGIAGFEKEEDREIWVRSLIDTLSEAAQTRDYLDGLPRLVTLEKKLAGGADKALQPYCKFSIITAEYMAAMNAPGGAGDFNKIQSAWIDGLRQFVKDFPQSREASDALSHLAINSEFEGKEDDAKALYSQIVTNFPKEPTAVKAAGALRRLSSLGKPMTLAGKTVDGKSFEIGQLAGKTVIVYYWASTANTTAGDVAQLKQLQAKYARDNVAIVGVSLDNVPEVLTQYLEANRLPWVNLHEAGGMDNRFANEMGIFTVPTTMLVDPQGKVIGRNIEISVLDKELGDRIRK